MSAAATKMRLFAAASSLLKEPSDGLEPSTPSLPSSNEEGSAGTGGKPRARKPRKKKESASEFPRADVMFVCGMHRDAAAVGGTRTRGRHGQLHPKLQA